MTLTLGIVDLGYGVFRYHVLTQSARQLARTAIVHGSLAERTGVWGPEPVSLTASDEGVISQTVASLLVGWNLAEVNIKLDWIDAGNEAQKGHRVRATMNGPYRPLLTSVLPSASINFQATSTMRMAH